MISHLDLIWKMIGICVILFADVGCDVFDFLIAQKYNIPMKKKSKQYQADPFAMEEILIMPHGGVVGYYSKTTQQ